MRCLHPLTNEKEKSMPWAPENDPYGGYGRHPTFQGYSSVSVTPGATDLAPLAKGLRIFVPAGTSSPTVTIVPAKNDDGAPIVLNLVEGVNIETGWIVRRVTARSAAGIIIHTIAD
jgi:hypothetical protein